MVILMVLGFMLAWTPYAVVAFWIFTNKGADFTATLMAVPAFFSKSSSLYNPIIYVLMNKQVRHPQLGAPRARCSLPEGSQSIQGLLVLWHVPTGPQCHHCHFSPLPSSVTA